jgi:hypothetical protein
VIASEALAEPELVGSAPTVLTLVVVARKQERVGNLPPEPPGHVHIPNQPNHSWFGNSKRRTADHSQAITFDDLGFAVEHEAERSPKRHEREWFE